MKVVIDTNVFVSSVFGGLPRRVIEQWFIQRITLCLSEEIFREYQRVLREIKAVSAEEERDLIVAFTSGESVLYVNDPPSVEVVHNDPDDDKFLACALALEADYVVSGDSDLLRLESYMGIPIVTPRQFLETLSQVSGPSSQAAPRHSSLPRAAFSEKKDSSAHAGIDRFHFRLSIGRAGATGHPFDELRSVPFLEMAIPNRKSRMCRPRLHGDRSECISKVASRRQASSWSDWVRSYVEEHE